MAHPGMTTEVEQPSSLSLVRVSHWRAARA
jgi:hypothetical protein